jgi:hypothetical protein
MFAKALKAGGIKLSPRPDPGEWVAEVQVPLDVRRDHTPLPGDRVLFTAKAGVHSHEVLGTYQFRRRLSYVILDDAGGEWEVQSMWEMKIQN